MMTKDEIDERRERYNKRTGKQEFEKGMKYRNGDGVPEDLERAFEHFEFAAACGHWQSMTQMGEMYGRGLVIDPYDGSPSADMAYCHFWMREGIKRAETKGQKERGQRHLEWIESQMKKSELLRSDLLRDMRGICLPHY